jgi:hypothetical protein
MRSAVGQAKQAYGMASNTANQGEQNASQIGSQLVPFEERELNNPTGYTPEEMNNMLVAGEQGAGGANAGIAGEAASRLARTRNSAGYSNLLDEAARDKTRQLSENALNVQNKSADLAQRKQQEAASELGNLYGTDVNETLKAQGLMNEDINSEVEAGKSGWMQNMTNLISSLSGASKGPGRYI